MEITLFYIPVGSRPEAESLGKRAVESRHAACANIIPMDSFYPWEEAFEQAQEWVLILKTIPARVGALQALIEQHHSYKIPCILHWNGTVNEAYGQWVEKMTGGISDDAIRSSD